MVFQQDKIKILNLVQHFPSKYGKYTKKQRAILWKISIQELIQQSYFSGKKELLLTSIRFLTEYSRLDILLTIAKELIRLVTMKIFNNNILIKKIKLFLQKIQSLSDIPWKKQFNFSSGNQSINIDKVSVDTYGLIEVPVNMLLARIWTSTGLKLRPVKDTPHFQWIKYLVKNNINVPLHSNYRTYVQTFFPGVDIGLLKKNVITLVKPYTSEKNSNQPITIVIYPPFRNTNSSFSVVIFDGIHRAVIAKALGHKTVNCRIVSARYSS